MPTEPPTENTLLSGVVIIIHFINSRLYHEIFTDDPRVTVKPQSSVFTGDTVTLRCDVGRSNGWMISWFKDFKRLETNDKTATLRDVKVSDGGMYACTVQRANYFTPDSQGIMLTVRGTCCFYRTI